MRKILLKNKIIINGYNLRIFLIKNNLKIYNGNYILFKILINFKINNKLMKFNKIDKKTIINKEKIVLMIFKQIKIIAIL